MQCIICHELFERPTTLLCGHTYCMGCIFDYIEENPSCPICKSFVSNTNLKVNIAIQKLIEKNKRKETARQNLSALRSTGSSREIKKIAFKLTKTNKYFYPGTNVEVKLQFSATRSELNNVLLNADFVGFSEDTQGSAYLFNSLRIISLQKSVATLFCQCKQRLNLIEIKSMEMNVGDAATPMMIKMHMALCKGKEAENIELEEKDFERLAAIEGKIVFFLNLLKEKNPEVFNHLKKKCSFTLTDQLSIDYRENPIKFLELVSAMLKFPVKLARELYDSEQFSTRLELIFSFVNRLGTSQDPVFFFEGEEESFFSGGMFYFFFALLFVIIASSIFKD